MADTKTRRYRPIGDLGTAILREMWADGCSNWQISARIQASRDAVAYWAKELGLPPKASEQEALWSPEKDEVLRQMRSNGVSNWKISQALGVSGTSVKRRAKRLGLLQGWTRIVSPWSEDADARLIAFRRQGLSASQIGKQMDMTKGQIIGRLHRLKVANPDQKDGGADKMFSVENLPVRVGKRVVLAQAPTDKWGKRRFIVRCDCGDVSDVEVRRIAGPEAAQQCRKCSAHDVGTSPRSTDLVKELMHTRIGKRVVVDAAPTRNGKKRVVVRCDCGDERDVEAWSLRRADAAQQCPKCTSTMLTWRNKAEIRSAVANTKEVVTPEPAPVEPVQAIEQKAPDLVPFKRPELTPYRLGQPIPPARSCDYVVNDTRPFQKCGGKTVPGRPYCRGHSLKCVLHKASDRYVPGYQINGQSL